MVKQMAKDSKTTKAGAKKAKASPKKTNGKATAPEKTKAKVASKAKAGTTTTAPSAKPLAQPLSKPSSPSPESSKPESTLKQATKKLRQGSDKSITLGGATIKLDMFSEMLEVIRNKDKRPPKIITLMILIFIILAVMLPLYFNKTNEEAYQAVYQEFYSDDKGSANINRMVKTLDRLAESKHGGSANLLGKIYFQGKLLEKDEAKAMTYYQIAAVKGYAEAQYQLAMAYYQGDIYEQNYETTVALLLPASRQGHMHAQRRLGYMYQHGLGTKQDKIAAYGWLAISGKLYNSAKIGLESLQKELNEAEIKRGEALAQSYMADYYNVEAAIKFRDEWFHQP